VRSTIELREIRKAFESTVALAGVDLVMTAGEIHGLCGQNGSGKSTLVKVLSGAHHADSGSVTIWGEQPGHSWRAADYGIAVIHQNLALVDSLTVLENFGVTERFGRSQRLHWVSWSNERRLLQQYAERVGLTVSPGTLVSELRPSDRSLLAIARALRELDEYRADGSERLLVLDEPTTYLPADEKGRLARTLVDLAAGGVGVLLVSHELDYVLGVCDSLTVLRDGVVSGQGPVGDFDKKKIVHLMIGRPLERFYPERIERTHGETLLRLDRIRGTRLAPLSLEVRAGEIVGITGLAGGGQEELPYLIAAAQHSRSETVSVLAGAREVGSDVAAPIGVIPANRDVDAMWPEGTAAENLTLASLRMYRRGGLLSKRMERAAAKREMATVGVRPLAPNLPLHSFSGGNQQKVILARWLSTPVRIMVLHEPVQGIDVAANVDIFRLIAEAASRGVAIVICSNEWEHLVNICDRVIALRDGSVVAELAGADLDQASLAEACQGPSGPIDSTKER
jgi:ribose transport system ATP-binding protein